VKTSNLTYIYLVYLNIYVDYNLPCYIRVPVAAVVVTVVVAVEVVVAAAAAAAAVVVVEGVVGGNSNSKYRSGTGCSNFKNGVFWVVTPCGSCKNRRFGGT
jgi:hypothetical protein